MTNVFHSKDRFLHVKHLRCCAHMIQLMVRDSVKIKRKKKKKAKATKKPIKKKINVSMDLAESKSSPLEIPESKSDQMDDVPRSQVTEMDPLHVLADAVEGKNVPSSLSNNSNEAINAEDNDSDEGEDDEQQDDVTIADQGAKPSQSSDNRNPNVLIAKCKRIVAHFHHSCEVRRIYLYISSIK